MAFDDVTVLVVDDHEHMRTLITTVLRALGFRRLHGASEGEEALSKAAALRPDLIITDLKMPVMDGVRFVQALRRHANTRLAEIPVIMVTGHAHEKNVREALAAGVNEFMAKPVTGQNLAERIRRIVEDHRPFVRSAAYVGPSPRRVAAS